MEGVEVQALDGDGVALSLVDEQGNPDGENQETSESGRAGLRGLPDVAFKLVFVLDDHRQELPIAAGTPRARELEVVWKPGS